MFLFVYFLLLYVIYAKYLPPPYSSNGDQSIDSITVRFHEVFGDTIAYELSKKSAFSSEWEIIDDTIGTSGFNMSEAQILSIRVDEGKILNSGTFVLGLDRSGLLPDDMEHLARTRHIPYDASAELMKESLTDLTNIKVREVRRCDYFGSNSIGHGGEVEGWIHGCPYGDRNGFRWLIVFDVPMAEKSLPVLKAFRVELGDNTWTGSGLQVSVSRIQRGMINPYLCYRPTHTCKYIVNSLQEGTPYQFRYRALVGGSGWTDYSKISGVVTTLQNREPTRPRPPKLSSTTPNTLRLLLQAPPKGQAVSSMEVQIREVNQASSRWDVDGVSVFRKTVTIDEDTASLPSYSVLFEDLQEGAEYEGRVRSFNHVGFGLYSTVSPRMIVKSHTSERDSKSKASYTKIDPTSVSFAQIIKLDPASDSLDVTLRVEPEPGDTVGDPTPTFYELEYMSPADPTWITHHERITLQTALPGTEVQTITTRRDSIVHECQGSFTLRTTTAAYLMDQDVSTKITFQASREEMVAALKSTIALKDADVSVWRTPNNLNGITYTIFMKGLGEDIPKLQVEGNDLKAVDEFSSVVQGGDCYLSGPSVYVTTNQHGNNVLKTDEKIVSLRGLQADAKYQIRVSRVGKEYSQATTSIKGDVQQVYTLEVNRPSNTYDPFSGTETTSSSDGYGIDAHADLPRGGDRYYDRNKNSNLYASVPGVGLQPGRVSLFTASGTNAADIDKAMELTDHDYVPDSGKGGIAGEAGGNGLCLLLAFSPLSEVPIERRLFFYTGGKQTYSIKHKPTASFVETVTLKCWGGGGGGGSPSTYEENYSLSNGGGGGLAQMTVPVDDGDLLTITVGGGGSPAAGERPGMGGFNGGASGGEGIHGGGGGGGGGASSIFRHRSSGSAAHEEAELLLIAAGGGGGGSTDYCCAHGGAGGGYTGNTGKQPEAAIKTGIDGTPWPLSASNMGKPTPVIRRYEYTSSLCPNDTVTGAFCISEWDLLGASLPAEHENLDYGRSPEANYSAWATAGAGGGMEIGGMAGIAGSFLARTSGEMDTTTASVEGLVAVYQVSHGLIVTPQQGRYLEGGKGGGGKEGGGGGGAGYYGGGGGGAGIDGAGGGGGSSFTNTTSAAPRKYLDLAATVEAPKLGYVNESHVTITWSMGWSGSFWGSPISFDVESSEGSLNEDFRLWNRVPTPLPAGNNNHSIQGAYTAGPLAPSSTHRFRVIPVFRSGRGRSSKCLTVTTLAIAENYWEPIVGRRASMARTGRGFTNPVLQRPHLSPGTEVHSELDSEDSLRWSDPTTEDLQPQPSPRRGHSMTLVDKMVYIFGGRTNGYSCATVYKDLVDLGMIDNGLDVSPCTTYVSEVNELWTLDIETYEWNMINTTLLTGTLPPREREQHSTVYVNGSIYVFGGKSRPLPAGNRDLNDVGNSSIDYTTLYENDKYFDDLWRLDIEHPYVLDMDWIGSSTAIEEDTRLFLTIEGNNTAYHSGPYAGRMGDGVNRRNGTCVEKVVVEVEVEHPCLDQLRISLMGPNSHSGSPNRHVHSAAHEVLLWNRRKSAQGDGATCMDGTHKLVFDDEAMLDAASLVFNSERLANNGSGVYKTVKPDGILAEFAGTSNLNEWTLVVEDTRFDHLKGSVNNWQISIRISPCVRSYSWHNISTSGGPTGRYQSKAIVYNDSFFLFHGKNETSLNDLWRFDTATDTWLELTPSRFQVFAFDTANLVGANFALSPIGLIRYGGYLRQPFMASQYIHGKSSYVGETYLLDLVTMRWKYLPINEDGIDDKINTIAGGKSVPAGRYLGGIVFVPSSALRSRHGQSYLELYHQQVASTHANYAGTMNDGLMMFGGLNGATGGFEGGEHGGMLNDLYMLRLANLSSEGSHLKQKIYRERNCKWRYHTQSSGVRTGNTTRCKDATSSDYLDDRTCDIRDLLMLAWCDPNYYSQSLR